MTAEILLTASRGLSEEKPNLLVDGCVEDFNSAVDELIDSGILKRVLAQTEISYSNSLIESWWRILKNQWLYLNTLDSVNAVRSLVEFYVTEHNSQLPHSAFSGQNPDEIYFGTNENIPEQLREKRATARSARHGTNKPVASRVPKGQPHLQRELNSKNPLEFRPADSHSFLQFFERVLATKLLGTAVKYVWKQSTCDPTRKMDHVDRGERPKPGLPNRWFRRGCESGISSSSNGDNRTNQNGVAQETLQFVEPQTPVQSRNAHVRAQKHLRNSRRWL